MVFGWFPWFCWLRTPQNCILAERSSLGLPAVGQLWPRETKKGLKDRRDGKLTLDYCRQQSQLCSCWSHCRKPGPGLFHPFCWKKSCDCCWRRTVHDNTICAQEMGAIYNIPPPRLSWSMITQIPVFALSWLHKVPKVFVSISVFVRLS